MVSGDGVLGSLLLADWGAAGCVVGVVTVHEAVVWSDVPLLRGAVSESAETAPSHVPRRTCGRESSRATHDRRCRGGLTLDAVARDGAMVKRVRRHVKPITTTRPTTRPAAPPSAPGWSRSRSRFPSHRFLEGGVGEASGRPHGRLTVRSLATPGWRRMGDATASSHTVTMSTTSPLLHTCPRADGRERRAAPRAPWP